MRIQVDKIASSTRNVPLHRQVVLGRDIPAKEGTLVAVRVLDEKAVYNKVEDIHGRMMSVHRGDVLAGVLGVRRALRGYSGDVPSQVNVGDVLHLLNLGGVIGQCTSANPDVGPPCRVEVLGSILQFSEIGRRVGSPSHIFPGTIPLADTLNELPPAVFVVGTCMHAGKTAAACTLVRHLANKGLRVGTAKVTGVALRRDTLEMMDYGATCAYTFADAGLPSTCGDPSKIAGVARGCMNAVAAEGVDVMVIEFGDGLLGDYGVMELLRTPDIAAAAKAIVLAANDPVAAWGGVNLLEAEGLFTTVVTGPATDNEAGSSKIVDLCDVPAVNARTQAPTFAEVVLGALPTTRVAPLKEALL